MVVRPSSCGTSSEGHYTSFTTKCRSYVLPAVNFQTKFREEEEIAPKSREEGQIAPKSREEGQIAPKGREEGQIG